MGSNPTTSATIRGTPLPGNAGRGVCSCRPQFSRFGNIKTTKPVAYCDVVGELRIAPAPGMPSGLIIPDRELVERYSHASGPGGQGVNTTDSRVQLSFDIAASTALDEVQRERLLRRLASRLAGSVLTVVAAQFRSQRQNRLAARERLAALLREGVAPPAPPRRASRPSRGSVERRLANKRRRSEIKRHRARPDST